MLQTIVTNDPLYMENGYILFFEDGGPCWFIDPGLPPQGTLILQAVREHDLKPEAIYLTHAHGDHIGGIDELRARFEDLPVYLAKEEWAALTDPMENLSGAFGQGGFGTEVTDPRDLPADSTISMGSTTWKVLDTSGHSPGGRTFYCEALKTAFSGDALFASGIGRTDFHHSDEATLYRNIFEKLLTLPDDTRVLSGHGGETTIGQERQNNPFLRR